MKFDISNSQLEEAIIMFVTSEVIYFLASLIIAVFLCLTFNISGAIKIMFALFILKNFQLLSFHVFPNKD